MRNVRDVLASGFEPWGGQKILIATHNEGKLREWRWLLAQCGLEVIDATQVNLAEPAETGETYRDNAELKTRFASTVLSDSSIRLILADDGGMEVHPLDGLPGVRTARFAQGLGGFAKAAAELQQRLRQIGRPGPASSSYHCAISLAYRSSEDWNFCTVEASLPGSFGEVPRGQLGFGFDSWFTPLGQALSFGEMAPDQRDSENHRAEACRELARNLASISKSLSSEVRPSPLP
ncbi:MAG: hypothetical protein MK135_12605 [Polyangiaceae bacterium]|nr:hypothetical protein [Polyangiaceae bacterium]